MFGQDIREETKPNCVETGETDVAVYAARMRRTSLAPSAMGVEGGGATSSATVSRLAMPQVMPVLTRPPLPPAATSDGTGMRMEKEDESETDSRDEEGMSAVVPTIRAVRSVPVSPLAARKEGSVQVAVRVRPLLPKEIVSRVRTCVESEGNTIQVLSNEKTFTFDHVFPMEAGQKDLYEQVVQPLMDSFLQGYNVTVLAYGQTGSGKTYTMGNDSSRLAAASRFTQRSQSDQSDNDESLGDASPIDDHEGVIPRFINEMFARLESDAVAVSNQVSVSFLEIYGEEIHDLLDSSRGQNRDSLQVRESNGSVWVQGLTEIRVGSSTEAAEQMRQGCLRRITGSTGMNERSSRSHAVYTVKIVRKMKQSQAGREPDPPSKRRGSRKMGAFATSQLGEAALGDEDTETMVVSKLTFVDLAGSERLKKTQAEGDRMKEGIQINVGLLALGNVITALGDERRRSNPRQHVAYRDSKLTRLLQDALGGNSRTLFIACISPAESSAGETVNTLQYASRAKNIQNKAVKNIDPRSAELARCKVLADVLRGALSRACSLVSGDLDIRRLDVDTLFVDPFVTEYLRKLEEIAWSVASGASSTAEANVETMKAMSALVARRPLGFRESSAVTSQESSSSKHTDATIGSGMSGGLPGSDTGSSVHFSGEFAQASSLTNLKRFCRVLEVVGLTLEMEDLKKKLEDAQSVLGAKISQFDSQFMQKDALVRFNEDALQKMATWKMDPSENSVAFDRQEQYALANNRLMVMRSEMEGITSEKQRCVAQFDRASSAIQSEIKQKQAKIQRIRQSDDDDADDDSPSPIDLLLQATELKTRFRLHELSDIAWALEDEEKVISECLDDDPDSLLFVPKFFPQEAGEVTSGLFRQIDHIIQNAVTDEGLHTSQRKKLRERARILQQIMSGWARDTQIVTEEKFLASNEEKLRLCEENIREIGEVVRFRRHQSSSIAYTIDAIDSLDLAKGVIRRLIDALYGEKRKFVAITRNHDDEAVVLQGPSLDEDLSKMKQEYDEKLNGMAQNFAKDLSAAYDMVKPFCFDSLNHEAELYLSQRQAQNERIADLEAKVKTDATEKQKMKDELAKLRGEMDEMRRQLGGLKELAAIKEECEAIGKELGLPPEEFQSIIAQAINPDALDRARQLRDEYRARRAEKVKQIEVGYSHVQRLEGILRPNVAMNLQLLHSSSEKLLDDIMKDIEVRLKVLGDEISQKIDSYIRVLDSIDRLTAEIEVADIEDLRHAQNEISREDLLVARRMVPSRRDWEKIRDASDSLALIQVLPFNSSAASMLSEEALDRNGRVLRALLMEKASRLAEMEQVSVEIRSLATLMDLSQDELRTVVSRLESPQIDEEGYSSRLDEDVLCILRKTSQLKTNNRTLNNLQSIRDTLMEVRDGRSNALSYVGALLEDAASIAQEQLAGSELGGFAVTSPDENQAEMKEFGCTSEALRLSVSRLKSLSSPTDQAIRALLLSTASELNQYGVETGQQLIGFFLGSEDKPENPTKQLLERFICGDGGGEIEREDPDGQFSDSLLSELDPAYGSYAKYFSPRFGSNRMAQLKETANDIRQIESIVISAQSRMNSLKKITEGRKGVEDMRAKIVEMAANANNKDRLFGNSQVLLKEEKTRKRYARAYPQKIAALRDEVQKWVNNDDGAFDLNILGEDMKAYLLDVVNTDTSMMHLDLGVLDPSRPSARRASKTAAGMNIPMATLTQGSSPNQPNPPNQDPPVASAPRLRPGSAAARDASAKKRVGGTNP